MPEMAHDWLNKVFYSISRRNSAQVRGASPRNFAENKKKKKKVCMNLREISRSFLRESSRLRIFVRGMNAKKELFSWAKLYG